MLGIFCPFLPEQDQLESCLAMLKNASPTEEDDEEETIRDLEGMKYSLKILYFQMTSTAFCHSAYFDHFLQAMWHFVLFDEFQQKLMFNFNFSEICAEMAPLIDQKITDSDRYKIFYASFCYHIFLSVHLLSRCKVFASSYHSQLGYKCIDMTDELRNI